MVNEKRLISFDDAMKATHEELYWNESTAAAVRAFLIKQPRVDAVEVAHGEWVVDRSPIEVEFSCSECGYTYIDVDSYAKAEYNYCPNCGAKMDGGNGDGVQ